VPFIVIATFTILNLFIGIIVSTMQELAVKGSESIELTRGSDPVGIIERIERDLAVLRSELGARPKRREDQP
jgi:voltage-gated sodium channel